MHAVTAPPAAEWAWGDLFMLRVPSGLVVTDQGQAIEFIPAHPGTEDADEREGSRAWLTVLAPDGPELGGAGPSPRHTAAEAAPEAILRFAASVGASLGPDGIHCVPDRGVTWARADFEAPEGRWQAIAIGWNDQVALFLVSAAGGGLGHASDDGFLSAMDALIGSWRPLEPVLDSLPARVLTDDDGF